VCKTDHRFFANGWPLGPGANRNDKHVAKTPSATQPGDLQSCSSSWAPTLTPARLGSLHSPACCAKSNPGTVVSIVSKIVPGTMWRYTLHCIDQHHRLARAKHRLSIDSQEDSRTDWSAQTCAQAPCLSTRGLAQTRLYTPQLHTLVSDLRFYAAASALRRVRCHSAALRYGDPLWQRSFAAACGSSSQADLQPEKRARSQTPVSRQKPGGELPVAAACRRWILVDTLAGFS
jgi:hypothetical protein